MKKVFVTGTDGFIGRHLTDWQLDTGFSPQMEFEEGIRKTINSIKNEYKVR